MLGRTLGDFVVTQRLGEGGGGDVYRAEQVTLGREAVIKVMNRSAQSSGNGAERFLREARLASQLDHPFAAHVYGFGTEPDGVLWIAMELVRGTALNTVIREQGKIPLARFVPFFERLCEVLHAAHEQGIVHRDVKPANVMVISRAGRLMPKLLDLGIARRGPEITEQSRAMSGADTRSGTETGPFKSSPSQTLSTMLADSETLNITQEGMLVGTPQYMSPEQWSDASSADARSDIYSLSLLAYQAITGKTAFGGSSLRQLAMAHAAKPLPALPEGLPSEVYDVLAQGAAKLPEDRFATAIELGAALRAASGLGVEAFALPQLDEGLRENVLGEAPQPIAEAAALLESARTPKQQLEAVLMLRRVIIRYLAVLALACRGRVGPGSTGDAESVVRPLRALASGKLTDEAWLSLAKELCRPFAFRKGAYPLPELVELFFAGDSDAEVGAGFAAISAMDALDLPAKDAPDDVVHAALLKLVPAVGTVLQSMAFIFDYVLVVKHEDTERWMGARRARRVRQDLLAATMPPVGVPFLVDSVGLPALLLGPLLQVFSPGSGLADELFFLDGDGRHGARFVALPGPFEGQSRDLWAWFSQAGIDVSRSPEALAELDKPPYKGLSTFSPDDADNYFGREREAESFANRLRLSPLLAVIGPSGSGKSSFVLAGVLPLLPQGWRAIVTRPGATPFEALAQKLGLLAGGVTPEVVVASLRGGESLLVVVDQFEELVTLCGDLEVRQAFASMLVKMAEHQSGRLRVVLTCRDDFLIQIQQLAALRDRLSSVLQLLGTPAKEELLRVVTEPAARLGYGFDDQNLAKKMVDEVAEYPGALALLSFTASQLWELRDRHLHQMRAKTYEALGGVGGALGHHAEMTLAQMSVDEAKLVREAFRQLVTSQMTRAVLSRKEMLDILGDSPASKSVLEKLVLARLLVTSEDASGEDRVEIIHEALIVSWPRLVGWLREDAETARLRDSLRTSAKQWAERNKPSGLLWRKETLAEYRVWRARFGGRLTRLEEEFASASLGDAARAQTVRRALALAAFISLAVGLVLVFRAYRSADASAHEAKNRLLTLRMEQGRLALLDQKPLEAAAYLAAGSTPVPSQSYLHMKNFADWVGRGRLGIKQKKTGLTRLAAAPSQAAVAAMGIGGGLLVDLTNGMTTDLPAGNGAYLSENRLLFATRDTFLTEMVDGGSRQIEVGQPMWEVFPGASGCVGIATAIGTKGVALVDDAPLVVIPNSKSPVITTLCSAKGLIVAFAGKQPADDASFRGLTIVDRGKKPEKRTTLFGSEVINSVSFAENEDLWVASYAGVIRRLRSTGKLLWETAILKPTQQLLPNPAGSRLAVRSGGDVLILDAKTGRVTQTVSLSTETLVAVRWSSNDEVLVGLKSGEIQRVDADLGRVVWTYYGSTDPASDLVVLPRQDRFATVTRDGTLSIFDGKTNGTAKTLVPTGVLGAWSSSSGDSTVYATADGWFELASHERIADGLTPHGSTLAAAVTTRVIAVADADTLSLVDRGTRKVLFTANLEVALNTLWFDPATRVVAGDTYDGRIVVFELARPQPRYLRDPKRQLTGGVFTKDSSHLVVGTDRGTLLTYGYPSLAFEKETPAHNGTSEIRFPSDTGTVFSVGFDGAIIEWDLEAMTQVGVVSGLKAKRIGVSNVVAKGELLSVYFSSGEWVVVHRTSSVVQSRFTYPFDFASVAASPDHSLFFAATQKRQLVSVPAWVPTDFPTCAPTYVLEGDQLTKNTELSTCEYR